MYNNLFTKEEEELYYTLPKEQRRFVLLSKQLAASIRILNKAEQQLFNTKHNLQELQKQIEIVDDSRMETSITYCKRRIKSLTRRIIDIRQHIDDTRIERYLQLCKIKGL